MASDRLKVFSDIRHAEPDARVRYLNPILKFFWGDGTPLARQFQKENAYFGAYYELTESAADADLCILPMTWNYYVTFNRADLADDFASVCRGANKPLYIFVHGDRGIRRPYPHAILIQYAGYRSMRRGYVHIQPADAKDVLKAANTNLEIREKQDVPVVGFCGQAASNRFWAIYLRNLWTHIQHGIHQTEFEPITPVVPHLVLRKRVLDLLSSTPGLETNFVVRRDSFTRTTISPQLRSEFISNVLNSDYTVCVRGAANYSIRFYEALSAGRIPIFVDTDCVLPFERVTPWKEYCVWVDSGDVDRIGEIVLDFHHRISAQRFRDMQYECRELWERLLSPEGFYSHLSLYVQQ